MGEAAGKGKERWPQVRLGDLITLLSGRDLTPDQYNDIDLGIPYITGATNIVDNSVLINRWTQNPVVISNLNDILLTCKGTVGEIAVNTIGPCHIARQFMAIRPDTKKIDKNYLKNLLTYNAPILVSKAKSMIPGITRDDVLSLKIPLPPLPEQRRIAAVLDQVSSLIALRKAQLSKLDLLVKARFVEMCDSTGETTSLSYYIRSLVAGKSLVGKTTSINKVLKTGAVTYDYFDATQIKNLPSEYEPQPEHLVRVNDVIISRMNTSELVGAAGYVWRVPNNIYLPDRLWRVEPMDHTNPLFLWHLLIQQSTKNSIKKIASGTSGSMKNISKSGLLGIKVKKVDLETQNNFAKFAKQTNKSKVEIQQGLIQLETLKKSLMQEYFG